MFVEKTSCKYIEAIKIDIMHEKSYGDKICAGTVYIFGQALFLRKLPRKGNGYILHTVLLVLK